MSQLVTTPDVFPWPFVTLPLKLCRDLPSILLLMHYTVFAKFQYGKKIGTKVPYRLKRYRVVCMGFRIAPATWQRLLERILKDILCDGVEAAVQFFVDVVAIGSNG